MTCEFEGESVDDGDCDAYMYHVYFMHKQRFRVGNQCMSNGKSPVNAPLTLSYIRNLL